MIRKLDQRAGFSLVEVTLALGVAAISLVAIFSFLPVGLQTNRNAIDQSASADVLGAVISDIRATPKTTYQSNNFKINIPADPTSALAAQTLYFDLSGGWLPSVTGARYVLTVTFLANSAGSKAASFADVKVIWPAPPATTMGSSETFAAFARN